MLLHPIMVIYEKQHQSYTHCKHLHPATCVIKTMLTGGERDYICNPASQPTDMVALFYEYLIIISDSIIVLFQRSTVQSD